MFENSNFHFFGNFSLKILHKNFFEDEIKNFGISFVKNVMLVRIKNQRCLASKLYQELDIEANKLLFGGESLSAFLHAVGVCKTIYAYIVYILYIRLP